MKKKPELTERSLRSSLRRLGDSAKQIAASLARRHIKGMLGPNNAQCPIANYLKKEFGQQFVAGNTIGTFIKENFDVSVTASIVMMRFIEAFDDGKFPNLVGKAT